MVAVFGLLALASPAYGAGSNTRSDVTVGRPCRVEGALRTPATTTLRCTLSPRGALRWRMATPSSLGNADKGDASPVGNPIAPLLFDVTAAWDRGVTVRWVSGRPSQGVAAVQWSASPDFATYDVIRSTGTSLTIPADWFAGRTTYYVRVFEMSTTWQRGPHTTENVTGHSNIMQFTLSDRPAGVTRTLVWTQRGSDIDGQNNNEVFGTSVALSGDGTVVLAGAPNGGTSAAGVVRIYAWNGSTWIQRGSEYTSSPGDRLGEAVAISADGLTIAMSAPRSDTIGVDNGQVNTYFWDGASWLWRGGTIEGAAAGDEFATSLALSSDGTRLAASSSNGGGSSAGYVKVYDLVGGVWTQVGLTIAGTANHRIGMSLAISDDGSRIAVGVPYGTTNGYVQVHEWALGAWGQRGTNINGGFTQEFGRSVAMSQDGLTVAIGSPTAPGGGTERGFTAVYRWGGSGWSQLGSDINGAANSDQSGWSVALSDDGNTVAIGSRLADDAGNASGTTRVYQWSSTLLEWILETTFLGEAANDQSGYSVALSADGRVVAIGAETNAAGGSQRGHVRLYAYE